MLGAGGEVYQTITRGLFGEQMDESQEEYLIPRLNRKFDAVLGEGGLSLSFRITTTVESDSWMSEDYRARLKRLPVTVAFLKNESMAHDPNQPIPIQPPSSLVDPLILPLPTPSNAISLDLGSEVKFRGTWINLFDSSKSDKQSFTTADGLTVQVPLMQRVAEVPFVEDPMLQLRAVSLPFQDSKFQLFLIQPLNPQVSIESLEATIYCNGLAQARRAMTSKSVGLAIPRFRVEVNRPALDVILRDRFTTVFSNSANFSRIAPQKSLQIDRITEHFVFDINESGVTASSEVNLQPVPVNRYSLDETQDLTSAEVQFRCDRPFIYMLVTSDVTSQVPPLPPSMAVDFAEEIILIGTVYNPAPTN